MPNRLSDSGYPNSLPFDRSSWSILRYIKFEPSFKLRWCRARDLLDHKFQWPQEGLNCESQLVLHVLAIFIDADTRTKRVQIGYHDMKILSFPDDNTIFLLRGINCHTRIQSNLKSHEKASSSKTNFLKIEVLWTVAHKNIRI